ncbi:SitI3 family protein [Glycomyces paridis]|uniref:Uncharacterized protein n=1 Tax=Glycomyces paridis TaxID=2126555 RepID=A0A4S8PKX3_9ACTN|nr:SitI3 family protein [Glycomyces paridis]THV29109.1 hypothetical protein E9998_10230 [Glycomyces paridis]
MAIEYRLDATPFMSAAAALDYFAHRLGCDRRYESPGSPGMAARRELQVTAIECTDYDDPYMTALLGVDTVLSVGFREYKRIPLEDAAAAFADMLTAAAACFEEFPQVRGVLSFQGENIYLQRLDGRFGGAIVRSDRLGDADFNVGGVLDALLAAYPARDLGMVDDLLPEWESPA